MDRVLFLESATLMSPDCTIFNDVYGSWGCSALWENCWFQLQWIGPLQHAIIATKELIPLVIMLAIWGKLWMRRSVCILSDNSTVVTALHLGFQIWLICFSV